MVRALRKGSQREIIRGGDREVESATKRQQENGEQMKTRTFRADWLIPVLGIALVGGGYFAMRSYLGLQEQIRAGEQYSATVDRFWADCDLSQVLMQAHASGCGTTARRLDELLSANVATYSARLASANPSTQGLVEAVTGFIDRRRSESNPTAGDMPASLSEREVAGQRPLMPTLASASLGK